MPRKARSQIIGKFFHVMVQGINKEYIFEKDYDKKKYLEMIRKNAEKNNVKIIAYCVMSNHVHFLINIQKVEDLSKCMHDTNTEYGMYYNYKNNRVGYVFRDRYRIQEIMNEKHLISCVVYIHKNPVKAEMVKSEEQYSYSSYNEFLKQNTIISNKFIELLFGTSNKDEYMADFIKMHKREKNYFFMEDEVDYNKLIKDFRDANISDNDIVIKLIEQYHLSERKTSELLQISRRCIRKALGKKL